MLITVLAWVFTGLLLVLSITCVAASRGGLRRNRFFGVKLPALERSDEAWRAGHAAGVVPATVAFVLALVAAVVGVFVTPVYWAAILVAIVGVIGVFISATRAADRHSSNDARSGAAR